MKSIKRKQPFLDLPIIFLLIAAAAFLPTPAKAIPTDSLDYVLYFLRSRGHSLFANAISTSDLLFDVLSLPSLTLLPPVDPALFAIDMTESPELYLAVLRLHVLPYRIDLRYLQNNASLHTLVPSRRLHATRADPPAAVASLHLDGVEVLFPALFDSSIVAVYGLQGVLPARFVSVTDSPPFQWFRPPPVTTRNRNWNRNATVIPPLVPAARPAPFTRPISPRRVPRSSGTNSPLPDNRPVVLSPPPPVNLTDSPESAPGDSVLGVHPFGRNVTVQTNQTSLPSADYGAPALPPISTPGNNSAVSPVRDNRGGAPAFPPIDGSSPAAQISLPPTIGDNFLPPEQEVDNQTAFGVPPILPPSSVDGASIDLAPSPVPLMETLPPAVCPPVNLTEVAVMVPAGQSPLESAPRTSPSPGIGDDGWPVRNVGDATSSGNDYPFPKRDDDDWEMSAGELAEVALGPAGDHVSTRDDYAMLGLDGVDYP
ncbi:unnamed protein product [Linum tenue]|uniref:FAS1 domain-containing protein n=1 Tax=Linum tenue TaxID=586396 RepID=A0AAV0M184_9ROSI|nr:unnamed protein product [Linum tenue]